MNIAIVGGGFTGLAAAYRLLTLGHTVSVFERDNVLGGLAHGFKQPNWEWSLEYAYHHIFTNDTAIISLNREIGFGDELIISRPKTATYLDGHMYQLDSPTSLLTFPKLPFVDRIRTGALIAFLKLNPWWQPLSGITAKSIYPLLGGQKSWDTLWGPLMVGKFGNYADEIAASWLWARLHKRTSSLGYFKGGFQTLIDHLSQAIIDKGGKIHKEAQISSIEQKNNKSFLVKLQKTQSNTSHPAPSEKTFDSVLLTTPTPIAQKLLSKITTNNQELTTYFSGPTTIPHLWAQLLILETSQPILPDDIYWLNINDRSFPFLAAVTHTHFMDKKYYGGNHLTYFGNYLPANHPYLSFSKDKLYKTFLPYIKNLTKNNLQLTADNVFLFTGPFAQPIHQVHYQNNAPKLVTPITNIFIANMDSIYPWDRGTNYAVELGENAARIIHENS